MAWLKDLEKTIGAKVALDEKPATASANRSDPRQKIVAGLRHNLSLLDDPDFRVEKKGKQVRPQRCVSIDADGNAQVWVSYGRSRSTSAAARRSFACRSSTPNRR